MPPGPNLQTVLQSTRTQIALLFNIRGLWHTLVSILLLGLLEGIILASVIPPWWHYDEPGHFEYAWLAANLPAWPKVGQYDQEMRREVGNSLMKYGWYQIRNFHPNLSGSEPIGIGVLQVGDPPGYYFLASSPLRFLHGADILVQYYAARSVSFLLYLLIILATWFALGEILSEGHPLRWMVPAFLALLPAFVDTMTSVNNDVGAVLAATIFLWASLKLMKRGYSLGRFVFLVFTLALCYLSKNTAWFAFLLTPFVLAFAILPDRFMRIKLGLTALVFLLAIFATLQWGSPLGWYQSPAMQGLPRVGTTDSPASNYAFQVGGLGTYPAGRIMQFFSPDDIEPLRGQTITLGEWMWASHGTQMESPTIRFFTNGGGYVSSTPIQLNLINQPVFYQQSISVPTDAFNAAIYVQYTSQAVSNNQIFFNGLVLTAGEFSGNPPQFTDPNGAAGRWDNKPFQNLISNGSAEQAGLRFRSWVDRITTRLLSIRGFNPPLILATIQDWQGTSWYYRESFTTLFRTFWASVAGDKVPIPWPPANAFLVFMTILGFGGAVVALWMKRKSLRWDILFILGMALIIPWMIAGTRGASDFTNQNPLYPWARYAYPAIFPTAFVLCAGWLEILEFFKPRLRFTDTIRNAIFLGGMFGLSGIAALDAVQAFVHGLRDHWVLLVILLILQAMALLIIARISRQPQN
jgi:hypothetical protein